MGIAVTSFNTKIPPRIYPELKAYFESLNVKEFNKDHLDGLESIKYSVSLSSFDQRDWNLIFYCSENAFRSQASQVFIQTLCYAKKYKKVKAYSAGLTAGEISPKLIAYLSKIGYKVTETNQEGGKAYEVKFSDQAKPILLFSKSVSDKSLPTSDVMSVLVCDTTKETECAALQMPTKPLNMAFPKVELADTKEKAESTLRNIATEMVYVTGK